MDNFDLKKFLVENRLTTNSRLQEDEVPVADPVADKDAEQGLKAALASIKQGISSIKPLEQDGKLDESLTLGLIVGAPGLLSLLGTGVNVVSGIFQKDKKSGTTVGNALKKWGHALEDGYLGVIGAALKVAAPSAYEGQDVLDKTSKLYDHAHLLYAALLAACAYSSGLDAVKAHSIIAKGLEGGLSAFKTAEVGILAQKIAAA